LLQGPHPQQPAKAAPINHQGERQAQFPAFAGQPLQAEQFRDAIPGVAPMAQPLEAAALGGT
jgi:hypothetical protein